MSDVTFRPVPLELALFLKETEAELRIWFETSTQIWRATVLDRRGRAGSYASPDPALAVERAVASFREAEPDRPSVISFKGYRGG